MAISVAGCAFALALFRTGWKIHALPGELYCERNGEKLEPFTLIARVADGEVKAEEWTAICARLGIADESVIVVKQAHA
jgi:hypothetical protein